MAKLFSSMEVGSVLRRTVDALLAIALLLGASTSSMAMVIAMQLSGAPVGNAASATAIVAVDDAFLVDIQSGYAEAAPSMIQVDVSGASDGNGSFGFGAYYLFYMLAPSPLDFGLELIGQTLANGCTFGVSDFPCDGLLAGAVGLGTLGSGVEPRPSRPFEMTTAGGERMQVISIRQIDEPGTGFLVLSFALLGFWRTPKRTSGVGASKLR